MLEPSSLRSCPAPDASLHDASHPFVVIPLIDPSAALHAVQAGALCPIAVNAHDAAQLSALRVRPMGGMLLWDD